MMNEASPKSERPATRTPAFFRIAVGLLAMLLLCGVVAALLLVSQMDNINRSGGWGWLLILALYAAATTVVCFACAICAAVSLWRREAHRRAAIAILIGSCLVVWTFGPNLLRGVPRLLGRHEEAARAPKAPPRQPADSIGRSPIPESLVRHFRDQGILLRPQGRFAGRETEWIIENAGVGPRCEVVVSFVQFWSGASVESMRNRLMAVSTPSVINEQARLAMFQPHARGKTSDKMDCEEWSAKSEGIVGQLQEAFRSYQPLTAAGRLNGN